MTGGLGQEMTARRKTRRLTDLFVSQTHDFRYGRRYTLMENEVRN